MVDVREMNVQPDQQVVLDRFMNACRQDDRILAAFLGGSYARGTSDAFSDLDIYLITSDEAFDDFYADRNTFVRQLGEPLFLETFGIPNIVFYILENGVEGELGIGRASQFETIHAGQYRVLLDKGGILKGAVFTGRQADPIEQTEMLRLLIIGFWHEWLHFTTALGRGQLWWAQGQLEVLRGHCVSLLRLRNNFNDREAGEEPYFKIEQAIPFEQLSRLKATFGPMKIDHFHKAAIVIAQVYKDLALGLAREHDIPYPEALEGVMVKRLEEIKLKPGG
jgi:predicted nucleotidyltransferase